MNLDASGEMVEEEGPTNGDGFLGDDEDREPDRETHRPLAEGEGEDRSKHEPLVGDGVQDGSEAALLVEAPGHPAIEGVAEGGGDKDEDRRPTEARIGGLLRDALPVVGHEGHEDGDEENADDGYFGGESHFPGFPVQGSPLRGCSGFRKNRV